MHLREEVRTSLQKRRPDSHVGGGSAGRGVSPLEGLLVRPAALPLQQHRTVCQLYMTVSSH